MKNSFEIFQMSSAHIDGVMQLEQRCFSQPWSRESVEGELTNPLAVYFVAVNSDLEVVGYAGMHTVLDEGFITNVAASPEHRRQGVASALIDSLIAVAAEKNLSYITLEVRQSNAGAIELYEKFNFKKVGLRVGYYSHPTEDAVLMLRVIS